MATTTKPPKASPPKLGARDVIELINAAKQAGISNFCWDALEFSFTPPISEKSPAIGFDDPVLARQVLAENESRLKQQQLEELMIADPEQYEELIAQGELIHAPEADSRA